jgi:hypothetical protein
MSAILVCPECKRKLRIPETVAGKSVRCPACKTLIPPALQAPAEAITEQKPAAPVVLEEAAPARPRSRPRLEADEDQDDGAPSRTKQVKKRSSTGMILGLVLAGGCLGMMCVGGGVAALVYFAFNKTIPDSDWQTFTPPNGGCTVLMPGTPVAQSLPVPGLTITQYMVERKNINTAFAVAFCDVPPQNVRPSLLRDVANSSRDGILAKMSGGKVISEAEISLGNMPGREYQIQPTTRGTFIGRVYLAKIGGTHRLYLLIAGGDTIQPGTGYAVRFFDSFQVTAPTTAPNLGGGAVVRREQPPANNPPQPGPNQPPKPTIPRGERAVWHDETSGTHTAALAFSPDNATLAVGHVDSKLRLWDVANGKNRQVIPNLVSSVKAVAFSRDGKRLACGCGREVHGIVHLWDVSDINAPKQLPQLQIRHTRDKASARALCFTPDGKGLAVALVPDSHSGSQVVLWDLENNKERAAYRDCKEDVKKLAFTPDGALIILMPNSVRVWDAATNQLRREFKLENTPQGYVASAQSPDGQRLATLAADKKLRVWSVSDGKRLQNWQTQADVISQMGFPLEYSPDGKYLALGGRGPNLYLFDAQTGKERNVTRVEGGSGFIDVLAFSPNGQLLACHSSNGPRIWDVAALLSGK